MPVRGVPVILMVVHPQRTTKKSDTSARGHRVCMKIGCMLDRRLRPSFRRRRTQKGVGELIATAHQGGPHHEDQGHPANRNRRSITKKPKRGKVNPRSTSGGERVQC